MTRQIAMGQLRERYRPIILYGDSKTLEKEEAEARKYLKDLTERGIILIKVPKNDDDGSAPEKALKGFGKEVMKKDQPKTGLGEKHDPGRADYSELLKI